MSLDFLNDVFLLHFAFETAQGIFERLAFLESNFRQKPHPPSLFELPRWLQL